MGAIEMSMVLEGGGGGSGGGGGGGRVGMGRWMMERLMPNLVPFEQIAVMHQLYISASVAISQIGPVLFPKGKDKQETSVEHIKRLQTLTEIAGKKKKKKSILTILMIHSYAQYIPKYNMGMKKRYR